MQKFGLILIGLLSSFALYKTYKSEVESIKAHNKLCKDIDKCIGYLNLILNEYDKNLETLEFRHEMLEYEHLKHMAEYYHLDKDKLPAKPELTMEQEFDLAERERLLAEKARKILGVDVKTNRPKG